jgi:hypothetical protein
MPNGYNGEDQQHSMDVAHSTYGAGRRNPASSSSLSSSSPANPLIIEDLDATTDPLLLRQSKKLKPTTAASSAMVAWLSWLAREDKHIIPEYDDLNGDQTERAILWEAVPVADPDQTLLSSTPVRAFVLLHMALGPGTESNGKQRAEEDGPLVQRYQADDRAELLAKLVTLPPKIFDWMVDHKGLPLPLSSANNVCRSYLH